MEDNCLQYCISFCHTSAWISHKYTYVPSLVNLHSFLRLSSIPLYIYTTFCLYIHLLMDIELFLYLLAIVYSTLIWTLVLNSFGYQPRNGILCLSYKGTANYFPQWLNHLTCPPAMGSSCFTSLLTPAIFSFFKIYSRPGGLWSGSGYDLHVSY